MPRISRFIVGCGLALAAFNAQAIAARGAGSASPEEAAKQKIFASQAWKQAMAGLNDWLSVQRIYPPNEVVPLKDSLVEQLNGMSAAQLRDYLADLRQKLAIVNSRSAIAIQAYVDETLQVASDAYAARFRRQLPDLLTMNALQLKQAEYDLEQRRASIDANEAAFQQQRKTQLRLIRQWNQQTAQAIASAPVISGGGGYAPPIRNPMPTYNPAPIVTGYPGFGWAW